MQLALLRRWKYAEHSDWTTWNKALAMLWLVGTADVITEAKRMDRFFWLAGSRIKSRQMTDAAWAETRDEMENARPSFINAARHGAVNVKEPVDGVPVALPPLSEIHDLFGSTPDPTSPERAASPRETSAAP